MDFDRVGVVGCGVMGAGIAEVCARRDLDVVVLESGSDAIDIGGERIRRSLDTAVQRSKLDGDDAERAFDRITFSDDMGTLVDRQVVIEAVTESETVKTSVFRRLDEAMGDRDVILASNTSSIPIIRLAMATRRPEQVIGIHFFNPVPVLSLVELVPTLLTSDHTSAQAGRFVEKLDKQIIRSGDRSGFIVNSLLIPYLLSAIRMFESGFATAQDIDDGMTLGCAHPMGPLALTDLIGLDTTLAIAESMFAEFKEPLYAPPPLLCRMVDAGLLGRKSDRGFYEYS